MSEWWYQLSDRERWLIFGGSIFLILFFIYFYLWTPLANRVDYFKQQIHSQETLLTWMQHANQEIQQYRIQGVKTPHRTQTALLVAAERTLAQKKLSSFLNQIQQPTINQLSLSFKKVPFDPLINGLQALWHDESINVTQALLIKDNTQGMVHAKITLVKDKN